MDIFQYILRFIKEYKMTENESPFLFKISFIRTLILKLMIRNLINFLSTFLSDRYKNLGNALLVYAEFVHIISNFIDINKVDKSILYVNGGYNLNLEFNENKEVVHARYIFYNNEGNLNIIANVYNKFVIVTPMENSYTVNIYNYNRENKDSIDTTGLNVSNRYLDDTLPIEWTSTIFSILTEYIIYYTKKYIYEVWLVQTNVKEK